MPSNPILEKYPNPRANAFVIMRFADTDQNRALLGSLSATLSDYGINPLRADMQFFTSDLWENVRAYMDACDFGVAVFEQIDQRDFNPNVGIELGYMLGQGKKVLLLREKRLPSLPTDITGQLHREFDAFRIAETVPPRIVEWLRDIGVAKSAGERLVLMVSDSGTCRSAMAKVALEQALAARRLPFALRVESVAHDFGDASAASYAARHVVAEAYGADHLQQHKVIHRNPGLLRDADLILVMEDELRTGLPQDKTFLFNEFFGQPGPVADPWPDGQDEVALARYRQCLAHLRSAVEPSSGKLVRWLSEPRPAPADQPALV
jgi:protein-tyrosine-phosphatase